MVRKDLFHSVHHYTIWYSSWYVQYISTFIALGSLRIATGSKQRKERKKVVPAHKVSKGILFHGMRKMMGVTDYSSRRVHIWGGGG